MFHFVQRIKSADSSLQSGFTVISITPENDSMGYVTLLILKKMTKNNILVGHFLFIYLFSLYFIAFRWLYSFLQQIFFHLIIFLSNFDIIFVNDQENRTHMSCK